PGHADPRRRHQPHHGRGARREHPPALHGGVRLRRSARRTRGPARRADLQRAAGNGRADPHPGVRRHRHRRHRLGTRRAGRRGDRRHRRYARPRLPQTAPRDADLAAGGGISRTGARLDAHLPAHGARTHLPAPRCVSRPGRMMRARRVGSTIGLDLTRRIMLLAIAAVSLNLTLGYGGLVSFGHAAYIGIGAYAVGILGFYGVFNGWLHMLVAIAASALVALAIGAVSIRTSGIYFIMITLAFTQMLYYLGISVAEFGGDDGMRLKRRCQLGFVDLYDPVLFYYVVLVL